MVPVMIARGGVRLGKIIGGPFGITAFLKYNFTGFPLMFA
jgi:hypothetical protein